VSGECFLGLVEVVVAVEHGKIEFGHRDLLLAGLHGLMSPTENYILLK
jgi:hypothetical protein